VRRRVHVAIPLLLIVGVAAAGVGAQTLTGRVLDEAGSGPVAGAVVSLLDPDGSRRADVLSDSLGRFRLAPPEAGEYVVEVVRLGYESTRSPLFALGTTGMVEVEVVVRALPIGLEGLEVSVEGEAEVLLGTFGVSPATLRNRWIGRDDIERMATPGLAKDIIRRQNIAGMSVDEYDSGQPGELCVRFRRSERACAITVLNGAVIPPERAFNLNPNDIEAIAILTPTDAATYYGTQGGGGAVLIWTREGR
jgi:hypothetical protein